jgi:cold shock CspA family protein
MFSFLGGNSSNDNAAATNEKPEIIDTNPGASEGGGDMDDSEEQPQQEAAAVRLTGQVKFFNDISMYGFIRCLDDGKDIFVHIKDLSPSHCVAPTLFTGEYVTFSLAPNGQDKDGSERFKAVDVKGIGGGTLLCDHGEITFRSYSRVGFNGNNE